MSLRGSGEPDEERHRYRWANRIAAVLAVAIGFASGLALVLEGIPPSEGIELTATETRSVTKGDCPSSCDKPETTDTVTTVETSSPGGAGDRSVLERALNNDIGVIAIRILYALLIALATVVVVRRIVIGLIDGWGRGHSGTPAKITPPTGSSSGSSGEKAPDTAEENLVSRPGIEVSDAETAVSAFNRRPGSKSKHYEV